MSYTSVYAASVEPFPGPHPAASPYDRGVGTALGVGAFGIYQVELPPAPKPSVTTTPTTRQRTCTPSSAATGRSSSTPRRCLLGQGNSSR
jgi:hypothetical protein